MGYKKTMWSDKSAFSSEKELENLLLVNDDNKCEVRNLKYYNEIDIPTIYTRLISTPGPFEPVQKDGGYLLFATPPSNPAPIQLGAPAPAPRSRARVRRGGGGEGAAPEAAAQRWRSSRQQTLNNCPNTTL